MGNINSYTVISSLAFQTVQPNYSVSMSNDCCMAVFAGLGSKQSDH